jgi:glycosyltransferase involved in cell wall biosynthesis
MPTATTIRLGVIDPAIPPHRLAVYRHLALACDGLRDHRTRRVQVCVWHANDDLDPALCAGVETRFVVPRAMFVRDEQVFWNHAQWLASSGDRSDVVMLNWHARDVALAPALIRARGEGVRTILVGQGVNRRDGTPPAWPRRYIARLADAVLTRTRYAGDVLTRAGFENVSVAPSAIDTTSIDRARAVVMQSRDVVPRWRNAHDLGRGPLLICESRLDIDHRIDVLLDAINLLRERIADVHLVVIGGGPVERDLREQTQWLKLERHVRFLGPIDDDRLAAMWYACATAFVVPSRLGIGALRALAFGCPVVTGQDLDQQGLEIESVREGVNGLFFSHNDPHSLAERLIEALPDPKRLAWMGESARQTIERDHRVENVTMRYRDAISSAMG